MLRLIRSLPLLSFLIAPLFAQSGDRAGEVQRPPPATLNIPPAPVLTPADEQKTFSVAPGFHVELVASDPLVGDPTSIQFAPDGRLWERTGSTLDRQRVGHWPPAPREN